MNPFEPKRRYGPLPYVFGALFGISLGLVIVSGILFFRNSQSTPQNAALEQTQTAVLPIDDTRRNAIVVATEKVAPAVVSVSTRYTKVLRTMPFGSRSWLYQFFGIPETVTRQYSSLGSGVIIHPDGYILTNEHVVSNADIIEVSLSNGETYPATVVGAATEYDMVLLKIDADGELPSVQLGDSDDLVVGEWAIAIGQPFGQLLYDTQPTVTVGVISAIHRDIKESRQSQRIFKDMIQTDAAINPGNSGGPLVNSRGEVVGINTFIFSTQGGGSLGMGFAIPINRGKWVLEEIQQYGRVRQVWVGLTVTPINREVAARWHLPAGRGLFIREIEMGSPADKAGLKPGDIIVAISGEAVTTTAQANRILFGSKIGDKLDFEVKRGDDKKKFTVVFAEKPNEI